MQNTMSYECFAMVGGTVVAATKIEAESIEDAKRTAREWLASLTQKPFLTQVILNLGNMPAWATPLPETGINQDVLV